MLEIRSFCQLLIRCAVLEQNLRNIEFCTRYLAGGDYSGNKEPVVFSRVALYTRSRDFSLRYNQVPKPSSPESQALSIKALTLYEIHLKHYENLANPKP